MCTLPPVTAARRRIAPDTGATQLGAPRRRSGDDRHATAVTAAALRRAATQMPALVPHLVLLLQCATSSLAGHSLPPETAAAAAVYSNLSAFEIGASAIDGTGAREEHIGGSGGSLVDPPGPLLEPPWPLLTHLHTAYMVYSECLPTRLNPLAERTCFPQAGACWPSTPSRRARIAVGRAVIKCRSQYKCGQKQL